MKEVTLRNMVIHVKLNNIITLNKLSSDYELFYEPELFPAALIAKWKPAHVACFSKGRLIITGVKSISTAIDIANSVHDYITQKTVT